MQTNLKNNEPQTIPLHDGREVRIRQPLPANVMKGDMKKYPDKLIPNLSFGKGDAS